jgi:ABC-type nitrate/sulfonate/bicarbonate transport system ATPase subunit
LIFRKNTQQKRIYGIILVSEYLVWHTELEMLAQLNRLMEWKIIQENVAWNSKLTKAKKGR